MFKSILITAASLLLLGLYVKYFSQKNYRAEKKIYDRNDYNSHFKKSADVRKEALKAALKIREFEINLYWHRSAYFWTFLSIALGAYGYLQIGKIEVSGAEEAIRRELSLAVAGIGFVLSVCWFFVNKASKFWQENWENHVDLLENKTMGPLYKVVLSRAPTHNIGVWLTEFVNGPASFSVSKINQIISFYAILLWGGIIAQRLYPELFAIDEEAIVLILVVACLGIVYFCQTYSKEKSLKANLRDLRIKEPE